MKSCAFVMAIGGSEDKLIFCFKERKKMLSRHSVIEK